MMENFLDDRMIIPDYIKKMSKEELDREIVRLEKKVAQEKEGILKSE